MDFLYGAVWGVFLTINFMQLRDLMRSRKERG